MTEFQYYKNRKPFQKADVVILLIGLVFFVCSIFFFSSQKANVAYVYDNGVLFGTYSLDTYKTVTMNHLSFVIDKDGVHVSDSDCQNQICVATGSISTVHQVVVCAPNAIVIVITGESEYDAIIGGGI